MHTVRVSITVSLVDDSTGYALSAVTQTIGTPFPSVRPREGQADEVVGHALLLAVDATQEPAALAFDNALRSGHA